MRRGRRSERGTAPIIRREEGSSEPAHGGAWKVAYADFVTAMMAFFLVLWLLNATTEQQRKGLADYFSPNNLMSHASSGTGAPFGGHTVLDNGALVSDRGAMQVFPGNRPITEPADEPSDSATPNLPPPAVPTPAPAANQAATSAATAPKQTIVAPPKAPPAPKPNPEKAENARLEKAAEAIRKAIASDPAVAGLAGQVRVDVTPQGLRVQLVDAAKQAMFAFGSAAPNDAARLLIRKLTPILLKLPGGLDIAGYTDAAPYTGPGRTNWELSTERANAARRLLVEAGIPKARLQEVTGHADRDPLVRSDPLAPANRRIAIIVLRAKPGKRAPD
ncbi:MAG: flagellar motor protein MotB [Acetobacteraceae bacterium]